MVATTTDQVTATTKERDDDDLLSGPAWSRHPTDIARFVVYSLALAVALLLCLRHAAEVRSTSVDIVELVSQLPSWVRTVLLGITQLYMVVAAVVVAVVLIRRGSRLMLLGLVAAGIAGVLMALIQGWVDDAVPNRVVQVNMQTSWLIGAAFPSGTFLAAFTAATVVLGPTISASWRRVGNVTVLIAAVLRVITAVAVPLNLAVTIFLGCAVGSAVMAIAGSPRRRVSRRMLLDGLDSAGVPAIDVDGVSIGATHSRTFLTNDGHGGQLLVKLTGRDERDAYLIQRLIKTFRVKGLEDLRPSWTVEQSTRHEALAAMLVHRRGGEAADVVAVGTTSGGDGLVVQRPARGRRLSDVPADLVTDDVLDQIWHQAKFIADQGMAHRWLTSTQILVDIPDATDEFAWEPRRAATDTLDGRSDQVDPTAATVTIVDFRWAVLQAERHQLAADTAMLVTSLALIVGAERSVAAAARVMSTTQLADALPLTQPLAMPSDVQKALHGQDHVLPAVRDRMQQAAGGVKYQLLDLERIKPKQIVGVLGGVVAVYTMLSFAASWSHIRDALRAVSPLAIPELGILGMLPYVIGAGVLCTLVTRPLPFGQVVELQLAQSFLNRFTPANSGGMALRIRYLQKRGVDLGGAAATIALSSAASAVGQVVVIGTFAIWAGSTSDNVGFRLPAANTVFVVLLVVTVLAGLIWFTPWGRRVIAKRVETSLQQVWTTFKELAATPSRFVNLFVLTILGKLVTIVAFTESARALDIAVSFPKLGLLYLTASSVASAAPTPGGVGAVEAALAAALTGIGVDSAQALSAVFLFRLVTYWLPVPFGYFALRRIRGALED